MQDRSHWHASRYRGTVAKFFSCVLALLLLVTRPGLQGDVRFICLAKDKKNYFTLDTAAEQLQPALDAADDKVFSATSFEVSCPARTQILHHHIADLHMGTHNQAQLSPGSQE